MRLWLALFLLLSNLPFARMQSDSQVGVQFSDLAVSYQFGQQATFQAQVTPADQVSDVFLFLQIEGEPTAHTEKVPVDSSGAIRYTYDLSQKPLRPFAQVEYWLRGVAPSGDQTQSAHQTFTYEDNRFTWQTLDDPSYQVHWQQGDLAFGQDILNAAQSGSARASSYLMATLKTPLRIYVYPRAADLQSALQLAQRTWVAGHASPDLGVILVSIPSGPEQALEIERQVPHELMHILTYQVAAGSYERLPAWFLEGLASLAELNPNPDYQTALNRARQGNTLLPLASLCSSFPREASGAFQAYAESASFMRFYFTKYGAPGLIKLIDAYKNGVGCEEGVSAATGATLEQLQVRWQQEVLGMDTGSLVLANLAPYLAVGLLVLLLPLGYAWLISTRKKARPTEAPKS